MGALPLKFHTEHERDEAFSAETHDSACTTEAARRLIEMVNIIACWEQQNLPVPPTQAGKDLFLRIALLSLGKDEKTLKNIYWDSEYASSGMRKTIKLLESDGWLQRKSLPHDLRCRTLAPTPKLKKLIKDYASVIAENVSRTFCYLHNTEAIARTLQSNKKLNEQCILILDEDPSLHALFRLKIAKQSTAEMPLRVISAFTLEGAIKELESNERIKLMIVGTVSDFNLDDWSLALHTINYRDRTAIKLVYLDDESGQHATAYGAVGPVANYVLPRHDISERKIMEIIDFLFKPNSGDITVRDLFSPRPNEGLTLAR